MQIRTRVKDGVTVVEVIDPSDGAVAHTADVNVGEQVIVNANGCNSPADIEVCAVEPVPEAEAGVAETGEQVDPGDAREQRESEEREEAEAEGAEAPEGGGEQLA